MRLVLRPPRPWWLAIANEHERRREAAQTLRLAMECDVPVYGLGDEWQGSRDVRIGFCHATFRRGPFGLRRQDGPVVIDELRAHHEGPAGEVLVVTSHRPGSTAVDSSRLVSNFLSISWVIDHREVAPTRKDEEPDGPSRSSRASAAVDPDWRTFDVRADGVPAQFRRLSIAGHWLALGMVEDYVVSVEGHGVAADHLCLSRVTDLPAWVGRRDAPTAGRAIVELGDRLGDLLGLP
ncbi:MAG TPA: hypothetical protein VEH29_09795 [Acidimicrobiales bacterium]|nr:hypothetical protein [Acidimicrobiales bacterium]